MYEQLLFFHTRFTVCGEGRVNIMTKIKWIPRVEDRINL